MFNMYGVFFDDFIPTWKSYKTELKMHVLVLVTAGSVIYQLNGERFNVSKGEILIIPRLTVRTAQNNEDGPHQKYTALFDYELSSKLHIPTLHRQQAYKLRIRHFDYLASRFNQLYFEFKGTESIDQLISLNLLQEILLLVSREAELEDISPIKLTLSKKIENYLMKYYRQPIEISDLANLIGRSPNYTSSLFRDVTGHSPIQFIHQLRMAEARRLLLQSDISISDLAQYLGYYDTSYFSRMFRKTMLASPADFRARNIENHL
ncbi:AraC family transcriptional regulator [Paenibacillus xylanexedens]|uniref:AraC family transcriptional regulator n=1 Tax=Paenibacillus xylanexedens TaxID=528191 RepID=UPI0016424822|nr:AraC family transcriptional regulator [Paenibacillus xylanexedens]